MNKNKNEGNLFTKSSDKSVFLDILSKTGKGFIYLFKTGIISIFLFIIIDQLSKQLAQYYLLVEGKSITIIPNLLSFTLVYNTGAAFGSMDGNRFFLIGSSILMGLAMVLFMAFFFKRISKVGRAALFMMIGGCFGNFIDRAFYPEGKVIDFIQFDWFFGWDNFPVCNLADVFLVCGIALFIIGEIISLTIEYFHNKKKAEAIEIGEADTLENDDIKMSLKHSDDIFEEDSVEEIDSLKNLLKEDGDNNEEDKS